LGFRVRTPATPLPQPRSPTTLNPNTVGASGSVLEAYLSWRRLRVDAEAILAVAIDGVCARGFGRASCRPQQLSPACLVRNGREEKRVVLEFASIGVDVSPDAG
jgi:hypothetical protein